MARNIVARPTYPLRDVKRLIRANSIHIQPNAALTAWNDFGWKTADIKKCLLKLNDRYFHNNPQKNHFLKTKAHIYVPNTMMDYYRAQDIMRNISLYTHFYVHPSFETLTISSFKEL